MSMEPNAVQSLRSRCCACVVNNGRILLIRSQRPSFFQVGCPQRTCRVGELPAQAALRELFEECGLSGE